MAPNPVPALARHHGIEVPPGSLDRARTLVAGLDVLPSDREARALDLLDQALGHLRLAGRAGPLAPADLDAVARLWTQGGETR